MVDKIGARIKGQFAGNRNKKRQIGKQLFTNTHTLIYVYIYIYIYMYIF